MSPSYVFIVNREASKMKTFTRFITTYGIWSIQSAGKFAPLYKDH